MKPAIIIIAFNRPDSLKRLLKSVTFADYGSEKDIPLCICIDYQNSTANKNVVDIATAFEWKYGTKEVIHQKENLGLRKHVLKSGDLVEKYGSIIMLEDDLYVSPYFYDYSIQALSFYKDDDEIGGISLYNHKMNFNNKLPFTPLADNSSIYFLKIASSWGQAWTQKQWLGFRTWFAENQTVTKEANIPNYVIGWPDKSWLKHFINYLATTNRYFVFPRISYTTNFSDAGTNNKNYNTFFQVPLQIEKQQMNLKELNNSYVKYDSFFELAPQTYKRFNNKLELFDFEVDLYGMKDKKKVKSKYLLTSKGGINPIFTYGLQLKPIEINILQDMAGDTFRLEDKNTVSNKDFTLKKLEEKWMYNYFIGLVPFNTKLKNILNLIREKVSKSLNR